FLTVALALVAAYPYIPGSDSPAFRYISLFIGFLLSLGSTSLVANIIAGIVLTYTRGLKVGDRVQIGETVGDVVDRTLLATRIRTIKHVVITIPNGIVLNSHIVNFSSTAQDRGLILNTKVTIGYNVPWRQVHMLLIEAALATDHILENPSPFVFQTSLNDVHITYEVNAYTREPELMATTYSELHQSIQDYFNTAGVEILSPTYSAWRDGNPSTIPIGDIPTTPLQNFLQHVSLNPQNPPPEQRP
ncbi:MAG: mechanosensitive ion channel, partial [Anaerolineales bacterium]|nr:mechanosensitive ion channel [Anaerolineales bacterium]